MKDNKELQATTAGSTNALMVVSKNSFPKFANAIQKTINQYDWSFKNQYVAVQNQANAAFGIKSINDPTIQDEQIAAIITLRVKFPKLAEEDGMTGATKEEHRARRTALIEDIAAFFGLQRRVPPSKQKKAKQ